MPDAVGRELPRDGTVLAFDYGEKKIGVALGNFITREARALTILPNITVEGRFEAVAALIQEWNPVQLIVGMPVNPEGGEQPSMKLARRFGNQLNGRFGLPVEWVDERYTSRAASMAGARRGELDAEAARIILQQYFDQFPL
ncbi:MULTISPECIES: Holliday junction resolvase RuvX [Cupriavidus]|jgi:putative holliday junction resolvase|uniref:Putative pre-16S rRNA nuclease n=7 Tax=Cupriavidus TaxID=106589 RepID=YQGF_CUPNH|nr:MULTISPECIES: Holliday junction resolvase RuvX [Cupriavidus]Q0K7N0.1 RecName: Full=Putative pre-16S rRNA nuclease [Cupriavidus necator H16]NUO89079.1 Holliday junction resolvase RuvX [Cupriavidus sp.]AMR79536.1 crossover junction endodeoxyribonuclease RuvA [Cupriavidus nantongensis]EON17260.1 Holliday junction resolvase-like protein [Cupriavidus sp. GA3-3]KAI3598630.1 putative pre-16S rRNA nuclease YqgF [Cupriavidus necator H850]MBB2916067.1 putative Holliday junction resolvase [Cupriavidu